MNSTQISQAANALTAYTQNNTADYSVWAAAAKLASSFRIILSLSLPAPVLSSDEQDLLDAALAAYKAGPV